MKVRMLDRGTSDAGKASEVNLNDSYALRLIEQGKAVAAKAPKQPARKKEA